MLRGLLVGRSHRFDLRCHALFESLLLRGIVFVLHVFGRVESWKVDFTMMVLLQLAIWLIRVDWAICNQLEAGARCLFFVASATGEIIFESSSNGHRHSRSELSAAVSKIFIFLFRL